MKKIFAIGMTMLAMGAAGTAAAAIFNDLTIQNDTDFFSTCRINGSKLCSSSPIILGDKGVTNPHSKNTIDGKKVFAACIMNRENCQATVYATADCSGAPIANVVFSTSSGVKQINTLNNAFHIDPINSFYIKVTGGK